MPFEWVFFHREATSSAEMDETVGSQCLAAPIMYASRRKAVDQAVKAFIEGLRGRSGGDQEVALSSNF